MTEPRPERKLRRLRRLIAGELAPPAQASDELELAAWLEGRLGEADAARVEAALSRDPALRQALRALAHAPEQALSPAELARALSLVAAPASPRTGIDWQRWFAWLGQPMPVGALALALLVAGFMLGAEFAAELSVRDARALAQIFGAAPLF